jgi:hypothetical protein
VAVVDLQLNLAFTKSVLVSRVNEAADLKSTSAQSVP